MRIICLAPWSVSQSSRLSDRQSLTSAVAFKETQQKEEEEKKSRPEREGGGGGLEDCNFTAVSEEPAEALSFH